MGGADVVDDGGGTGTFHSSRPALRPHKVHAYYGPPTGVPTLRPTDLPNSTLLTYSVVHHHFATREAPLRRTGEVFDLVLDGRLAQRVTGRCAPALMPSWTVALPLMTQVGCVTPPVAIRTDRAVGTRPGVSRRDGCGCRGSRAGGVTASSREPIRFGSVAIERGGLASPCEQLHRAVVGSQRMA
ncbi:hypothetical protein [Streptomyces sp. NPDC087538]|uniref:hypothetical protein n=1 Tax=Streptomyces sp. NPDC087538 TaxID=3365797 RepID=UPI00382DFBE9